MEFTICGHIETVSDDELHAHTIHTQFKHRAQAAQDLYQRKYEGYQSWGTFVTSAPKDGYGIIADELEYCVKSLVAAGKYNISSDYLYQKYGELILEPWDDLIDEICHLLEEVNGVEAQARYAREVRKASRGQVVGGGFGASGAVKGMAFAGAANMATGAAHSIANAIGNAKTRNEIARREAELYQDNDFKKSVCERIYYAVERIGGCMIVELGIDGENVPPRDRQTAINLMKNYPIVPQKDRLEVLLHALNCDRYNLQVYEHLILEFRDSEEAVKIGKLFGLGAEMDEICSRVLCNYFPPRPKLAAKSLQQKTDLLKGYRLKKAKLGVYKEFPEVHELEAAIIQEFVPEGWETMEPADIPGLLAEIQQKKQEYEIDFECVVEQTLKKNFLRAKTVNGKLYSTLEEAKKYQALYDHLLDLCKDIDEKSYDELVALNRRIVHESPEDPWSYAGDIMENLQEKINLADTNRRTYLGLLFKTTEDVTFAKELRVQAEEFVEKCDFGSGKSVEDTKKQLALLKGKLKPCCIEDYIARIDKVHQQLCTYRGETFSTYDERMQVENDYLRLEEHYLNTPEKLSAPEITEIRKKASMNSELHQTAKKMFDRTCRQLVDKIQQEEKEADISRVQKELRAKYSSLDLTDRSKPNFERLNQAVNELKEYDAEYTRDILQPIEGAIKESNTLYDQETTLRNSIKYAKVNGNPVNILKSIVKNFLTSVVVAIVALFVIPIWWLQLLILIGAIGMFFQESGKSIKETIESQIHVKELEEELEALLDQIGE